MSLGKISTWIDKPYRTFQEEVSGALDGKEFQLVEPGTADNSVKLNASASGAIGVMFQKLQNATAKKDDISVRLLGKGGTVKVIQNAAIAYGAYVVADPASYTRVKTQPGTAGTYRTIGRKVSEGAGAAGDVIEIVDLIETVVVAP